LNAWFFSHTNIINQLVEPPLHDLWSRLIVSLFVFTIFIVHGVTYRNRIVFEAEVKHERVKVKTYLNTANVFFVVLDVTGKIQYVNNTGCNWLGYDQTELMNLDWFDRFVCEDDRLTARKDFFKLVKGEASQLPGFERVIKTKLGNQRLVSWNTSTVKDDDGHISQVILSGQDITEKRLAEKERENIARFPTENPAPIFRIDAGGKIQFANPAARAFLDSWEVNVGDNVPMMVHGIIEEILDSDEIQKHEYEIDDDHFLFTYVPFKSEGYVNIYGTNITDLKAVESELKKSEERFRSIFDNAVVGIYRTTPEGKILEVNPKLLEMLGFESVDEIKASRLDESRYSKATPRSRFINKIEEDGKVVGLESEWCRKDGSTLIVRENAIAVRDEDGNTLYYEGTIEDITENRRAELVQHLLYQIAQSTNTTIMLEDLLHDIHKHLGRLIDTTNFFVALYDNDTGLYSFPYAVDEIETDEDFMPQRMDGSLTDYVRCQGEPLLIELDKHEELARRGDITILGPQSKIWMGVPLKTSEGIIGVVVVQSYHNENAYSEADLEIMMYVSENIAQAIDRKRAEGQIKWQKNILDATNKILLETLQSETEKDLAETCLAEAQELTGSAQGFIGEINSEGKFDIIAMDDPGWNECRMERSDALNLLKNMEIRGLWSKSIKHNSTQIINIPYKDPDRVGLPEGHPPIKTLITVPLKREGNTIGVIALANKEKGYNHEDAKALESLSVALVEALIRKRSEDELKIEKTYLQQLFESSPEAITLVDNDSKILRVNSEFTRLFGYTIGEALGQSVDDLLAPDDFLNEATNLTKQVAAGEGVAIESVRKRKDGSAVDVSILGTPIIIGEGQVAVYAIYRDITARKRAQAELIRERQQLLSIFDSIDEVVYVCDPVDYNLLYVNEAGRKQLGVKVGDLCHQALHGDDNPCPHCKSDQEYFENEGKGITKEYYNGSNQKWFRCMAKAISWPDRDHKVRYEMAIDVTERKENEKNRESILRVNQLLLSELDIRKALRGLSRELGTSIEHDLIAIAQLPEGQDKLTVAYSKSEHSKLLSDIESINDYKGKFKGSLTAKMLKGNKTTKATIPAKGNGELKKLRELGLKSYLAVPLVNSGTPLGMLYVASASNPNYNGKHNQVLEQITSQLVLWLQHHRLIQKLSDSEAKYRTLFDNSNDIIYIIQGKRFAFVNRKFEELLEYTLDEVNHPDFDFMKVVAPESRPMVADRSRRADKGEILDPNYEFKGLSKSGKIYDFDVSVSYVNFDGKPAVQGILRDISEKKQFAAKEKEMHFELVQHSKLASIGMLAAGIAHNMNVPLQGIQSLVELLKMTHPDTPYLNDIIEQVHRIGDIISNMLFKSRQEQHKKIQEIDLNQLLSEELKFLHADLKFKHEVEKDFQFDENLPKVKGIYSDFSQSILNIIKNALDAMYGLEEKRLTVRTKVLPENRILIEIEDNGQGIPEDRRELIFSPFFTTKPTAEDRKGDEPIGTGLGLSSSLQLLKKYDSNIEVESEVGKGTKFKIYINPNGYLSLDNLEELEDEDLCEEVSWEEF